ncbi:MAG: hypothetical protein EOP06_27840, partial [Proteobacteria bacterium]
MTTYPLFSDRIRFKPLLLSIVLTVCGPLSSAFAADTCEHVFSTPDPAAGAMFLHARNGSLHSTAQIELTARRANRVSPGSSKLVKPIEKIENWLQHLSTVSRRVSENPNSLRLLKQSYFAKHVIRTGEIPESYFNAQVNLARERGLGTLILTNASRSQLSKTVINDQTKSLESWIDYLTSADADVYPTWAKYWAFTSLVRLGKFNPDSGLFANRDRGHLVIVQDDTIRHLSTYRNGRVHWQAQHKSDMFIGFIKRVALDINGDLGAQRSWRDNDYLRSNRVIVDARRRRGRARIRRL